MAVIESKTNLWEVLAGRSPGQPLAPADADLWRAVTDRLNPAKATPRVRDGIETSQLVSVRGEPYVMLRSPGDPAGYLRLSPDEAALAEAMDGTKTVAALVGEYAATTGTLAPDRVLRLVADLAGNRMLEELPVDSFHPLQRFRSHRGPLPDRMARTLLAVIRGQRMVLANPDRLVGFLYRVGGRLLFTRLAAALVAVVAISGLVLFGTTWLGGAESLFLSGGSYVQGAALLLGLNVVALASHELGHGLAAKHAGRRVPAVGFLLYFGLPSIFVDTTDVWMAGRRARILTSAAGPLAALTFAGAIQLTALAVPALGPLAFKIAFVWYLNSLFNLNPLMALDGYYLFMDWLELPNMRPRAMSMIVGWARHRRPRWRDLDKEDRLIAVYALLALGWVIVMVNLSIRIWRERVGGLVTGLWHAGPWARALLVVVVIGMAAPVAFAVVGWLSAAWHRLRARARERHRSRDLPRRVDALRSSAIGLLREEDLTDIAEVARWLRPRRGTRVIGGPGAATTNSFVVVEGSLEGRAEDDPPGTVRHRARPGDMVSQPPDSIPLAWVTVGTLLLSVPARVLGEKLVAYVRGLPVDDKDDEESRLFSPLLAVTPSAAEQKSGAAVGAHPIEGYTPLTPRPGVPRPGDDDRDRRFLRTLVLLLLLTLLLAVMTAPLAAQEPKPWLEMPPNHVLLYVERGEVVVNPGAGSTLLGEGERRYLGEADEVEVLEKSTGILTFEGGGTVRLCALTQTGIGPLSSNGTTLLQPTGDLFLRRGTALAETESHSLAFAPLMVEVHTANGVVANHGSASFAVSTGSVPLQVLSGEVSLDGVIEPTGTDVSICPSGTGGGQPTPSTSTTTTPSTSTTTLSTTTTTAATTTTPPETTTTAPQTTTTSPSTTTTTTPATTTTPPTTTTTTEPGPPPVIGGVRLTVTDIYEVGRCLPVVTDVVVAASNAESVRVSWTVNTTSGSGDMAISGRDTWRFTLPTFPAGTLTPGQIEAPLIIDVIASNQDGTANATTSGTLHFCTAGGP